MDPKADILVEREVFIFRLLATLLLISPKDSFLRSIISSSTALFRFLNHQLMYCFLWFVSGNNHLSNFFLLPPGPRPDLNLDIDIDTDQKQTGREVVVGKLDLSFGKHNYITRYSCAQQPFVDIDYMHCTHCAGHSCGQQSRHADARSGGQRLSCLLRP